jgi:hypothetical protein
MDGFSRPDWKPDRDTCRLTCSNWPGTKQNPQARATGALPTRRATAIVDVLTLVMTHAMFCLSGELSLKLLDPNRRGC